MTEKILTAQDLVGFYIADRIIANPGLDPALIANSEIVKMGLSYRAKKDYYDLVMNFGRNITISKSPLAQVINKKGYTFSEETFRVEQDLLIEEITKSWQAIALATPDELAKNLTELTHLL